MREDRFDDKIRELLSAAHEDYDTSSWDKLNERLDAEVEAPSTNDVDISPVVKEKLENHRVEVSEEHWNALRSDLDFIEERKERLYIIKALEAVVVLLLLYTYFNYKWINGTKTDQQLAKIEEAKSNIAGADKVNETYVLAETTELSPSADINTISPNKINVAPTVRVVKEGNLTSLTHESSGNSTDDILEATSDVISSVPAPLLEEKKHLANPVERLGITGLRVEQPHPLVPDFASLSLSDTKANTKLYAQGWSVGIPISYDINFINTDINLGYLSNQIESGLEGKSFGITVGYRKGIYELESGIKYSHKTFVPGLLTNYFKSQYNNDLLEELRLDHMVIQQVQVPVLGKIYAAKAKRTTLYAIAGIAANAILANKYAIRRSVQAKARYANTPASDVVDLENLPAGLLQKNGSVEENIYMSGVVGFGVQSYVNNGVSWYVQPQYQHSFSTQITELVSQVNVLSIEGGFKFSF